MKRLSMPILVIIQSPAMAGIQKVHLSGRVGQRVSSLQTVGAQVSPTGLSILTILVVLRTFRVAHLVISANSRLSGIGLLITLAGLLPSRIVTAFAGKGQTEDKLPAL